MVTRRQFFGLLGGSVLLPVVGGTSEVQAATNISVVKSVSLAASQDGEQEFPVVAPLPGGGFAAAWRRRGEMEVQFRPYFARYTGSGGAASPAQLVSGTSSLGVTTSTLGDGATRVFLDEMDIGFDVQAFAQKMNSSGQLDGTSYQVSESLGFVPQNPNQVPKACVKLKSGNSLLVWQATNVGTEIQSAIYRRRLDANGSVLGSAGIIVPQLTDEGQLFGALCPLKGGGAVIAYTSCINGLCKLKLRRLDSAGNPVGSAIVLRTLDLGVPLATTDFPVALVGLSTGGFAVYYHSWNTGKTKSYLTGRVYSSSGKLKQKFKVRFGIDADDTFNEIVAAPNGDDRMLVVANKVDFTTTVVRQTKAFVFSVGGKLLDSKSLGKVKSQYHRPWSLARMKNGRFVLARVTGANAAESRAKATILKI